ncbi:MAG: hypothetical protein WCO82_00240 [Sphingomonadales bacterium]
MMARVSTVMRRVQPKRRGANSRLYNAARVLGRFDLPMLMLTAQTNAQAARTFITSQLVAGRLAGPALHRKRNIDGWVWTFIGKGASA